MTATEERITEMRAEVDRREVLYEHATRELNFAKSALAEAEGDVLWAKWYRALAMRDAETVNQCAAEWAARKQGQGAQP